MMSEQQFFQNLRMSQELGLDQPEMTPQVNVNATHTFSGVDYQNDERVQRALSAAYESWGLDRYAIPARPNLRDKSSLIETVRRAGEVTLQPLLGGVGDMQVIVVGQDVNCSNAKIEDLRSIYLRNMQNHRVHKGFYLLCRVVSSPNRCLPTEVVIEDQMGSAVLMSICHFIGVVGATTSLIQSMFPIGQLLLIREPRLKQGSVNDHSILQVDSPSDLVFLSGSEPMAQNSSWTSPLPSIPYLADNALSLKAKGTSFFQRGLLIPAVRMWSLAIERDCTMPELYANRAQAYLSLEWFPSALRDSERVLSRFPTSAVTPKALYRAAVALYGLARYKEALEKFKLGTEPLGRRWESKCIARIEETEHAKYNWVGMFAASQGVASDLDVASFTGPIRVTMIPNRGGGRGVVATKAIKMGDLLMVSKPFASYHADNNPDKVLAFNFETKHAMETSHLYLMWSIITKLHGSPERVDEVYHLYAGSRLSAPPSVYPPLPRHDSHLQTPLVSPLDVNVTRISGVISCNTFETHPLRARASTHSDASRGAALYTLPSLINHACDANANRYWFGDVIVIRAVRDIDEGGEITIPYNSFSTYSERTKDLEQWLEGAVCGCNLCAWDRRDAATDRERRAMLFAGQSDGDMTIGEAFEKARQLAGTYQGSKESRRSRPELFSAHTSAQDLYLERGIDEYSGSRPYRLLLVHRALKFGFKALGDAGYQAIDTEVSRGLASTRRRLPISKDTIGTIAVPIKDCLLVMSKLSFCFSAVLHDSVRGERWLRAAWWAHNVAYGGGEELFDAHFKSLVSMWSFPVGFLGSFKYGWE